MSIIEMELYNTSNLERNNNMAFIIFLNSTINIFFKKNILIK